MKKILIACVFVSGCSLLPTPHDPALASAWTEIRLDLGRVSCENTAAADWDRLQRNADFLKTYAEFRRDNQVETAQAISENLGKARASRPRVCEHWIKLTDQRLKVLDQAWSGR
jgi:hypothetical protein